MKLKYSIPFAFLLAVRPSISQIYKYNIDNTKNKNTSSVSLFNDTAKDRNNFSINLSDSTKTPSN